MLAAKLQPDGSITDRVPREPRDGEIGLDEIAPHQPGDRLILDPDNPRRAIVAPKPAPTYAERRAAEYPSAEALTVALWELLVEKRPAAADALQAQREAVKAKHPKPALG